jgi:hypothetical protein
MGGKALGGERVTLEEAEALFAKALDAVTVSTNSHTHLEASMKANRPTTTPVLTATSYKEGPGHDGPSFSAMVLIDGVKAVEVYDGAFGGEFEYRWQTTDPDQRNAWQEVIRQAGIDWGLRDTGDYCWTDEQKAHMRAHRTENPIPPLEGAGQDGKPWTPYPGINRDCLIDDLMGPLRDRKQMIRYCSKNIPYRLPDAPPGEWMRVTKAKWDEVPPDALRALLTEWHPGVDLTAVIFGHVLWKGKTHPFPATTDTRTRPAADHGARLLPGSLRGNAADEPGR